jgi:Cu(I)/Ag(I) efflux system membrane fusion protein
MNRIRPGSGGAILGAALALLGAVGECQGEPASRAAPAPTTALPRIIHQNGERMLVLHPGQVPGMSYSEVRKVELPGVLETTGMVTFDDRRVATIISRVQGRIEDTRVSLWDNVRRGEPIVKLYSPDFMTAEAEFIQALTTSKLSTPPKLGADGANLAGALVSAARRKLELLGMEGSDIDALKGPRPTIWMRAPMSGTVVKKNAVRGSQVNPGDVLYMLGTLNDVWITADIYEDELARVSVGQELQAVTTAFPTEIFRGRVARISPGIDLSTHTAEIRCEVENPGLRLRPDMLARVKILTRPGRALMVSQDALVFETNAYYAFVDVGKNRLERRKVAIASWTEHGYARVISGLSAGERVVTGETLQVNALWHQALGAGS